HGTAASFEERRAVESSNGATPAPKRSGGPKTKEQKRREAEERNRRFREGGVPQSEAPDDLSANQLRKLHEEVEAEILVREGRREALESALGDPDLYADAEKARITTTEYEDVQRELKLLYERWERLAERISSVESA